MRRTTKQQRSLEEQEEALSGGQPLTVWAVTMPTYRILERELSLQVRARLLEGLDDIDLRIEEIVERFMEDARLSRIPSHTAEIELRVEMRLPSRPPYEAIREVVGSLVADDPNSDVPDKLGFRPSQPNLKKRR